MKLMDKTEKTRSGFGKDDKYLSWSEVPYSQKYVI